MIAKIKEHICSTCNGTGYPPSGQSTFPGRKIYPTKCPPCLGKGRISETSQSDLGARVSQSRG